MNKIEFFFICRFSVEKNEKWARLGPLCKMVPDKRLALVLLHAGQV